MTMMLMAAKASTERTSMALPPHLAGGVGDDLRDGQGGDVGHGLETAHSQRAELTELALELTHHGDSLHALLADAGDDVDAGGLEVRLILESRQLELGFAAEADEGTVAAPVVVATGEGGQIRR